MKAVAIRIFALLWLVPAPGHAEDAMEYFNLGLKSTMTPKKIEFFTKALEANPRLAAAYEERGLLYYFQEKYDKVVEDFQTYLELAPAKAEAYRMLGLGYLRSGMHQSAVVNFTRAIEKEPTCTAAYANRAEAYRLMHDYEAAIRDATTAIQLGSDARSQADAYRTRARIFRKIGRTREAVADTRAAYWADPSVWHYSSGPGQTYSTEDLKVIGLINIIAISFVLIVLRLRPPG